MDFNNDNRLYLDLVWKGIATSLNELGDIWWEYPEITRKLNTFSRVGRAA